MPRWSRCAIAPPLLIGRSEASWLYLRFTLSYRDVQDLLAERGLDLSYETVRSWVLKFGPVIARRLRRCRPRPSNRWHLDGLSRTRFLKAPQPRPPRPNPAPCRPRHART